MCRATDWEAKEGNFQLLYQTPNHLPSQKAGVWKRGKLVIQEGKNLDQG